MTSEQETLFIIIHFIICYVWSLEILTSTSFIEDTKLVKGKKRLIIITFILSPVIMPIVCVYMIVDIIKNRKD